MTPQQVDELALDCTEVARRNWDGEVTIDEQSDGSLLFISFNEEGDIECEMTAVPVGAFNGDTVFSLRRLDHAEDQTCLSFLVPVLLVGYMGL